MKTRAARLYGANDARLEEFELRPITSGELLIKIISDSVCMSTRDKVVMPPVLSCLGGYETVGYTFEDIGGVSTYSIVYEHILDNNFLIKSADVFFNFSAKSLTVI